MGAYIKTYSIPSGTFTFEINANYAEYLNFEIINGLTQEFGFEDDDELTFYPGVLTIEISDPDRTNFKLLQQIADYYTGTGENHVPNHYIKGTMNGKIFRGFIDRESFTYTEETRVTKFDCIDVTKALTKKYAPLRTRLAPYYISSPAELIYETWKEVYPTIPCYFSENSNQINNYGGFYWLHDWLFVSKDINGNTLASSSLKAADLNYPYFWQNCVVMVDNPFLLTKITLAEYLKFLAREFGMVIGTMGYNQVYCRKRYTNDLTQFIEIPENSIINYNKIGILRGVGSCKNRIADEGSYYAPMPPGSEHYWYNEGEEIDIPYNIDRVLEITTYLGVGFGDSGAPTMYIRQGETLNPLFVNGGGVRDMGIPIAGYTAIGILLAYWNFWVRRYSKPKYELEVIGIDYDIYKFYYFTEGTDNKYFRPVRIVKDYINNKSTITGILNSM